MIDRIKGFYTRAKRVALLAHDNTTRGWYHVFSVIELLPPEIPAYNIPTKEWYQNKSIRARLAQKTDEYTFHLIVTDFESVLQALESFSEPHEANIFDGEPNHFFNQTFVKEPTGTSPLVIPSNIYADEGLGAILPKREAGTFVWTQIDHERKTQNRFFKSDGSREMKAMSQLTLDWLGFDIWNKAEHIGNIYLSAPNPYFRSFDVSLSTEPPGIYYSFNMREGVEEQFSIRIMDSHGDNIALDSTFRTDQRVGLLQLPHEPHNCEIRIYNSHNDLVNRQGPMTFIKSIQIGLSMKQADFNVSVQGPKGHHEFTVEKYSKEIQSTIGTPTAFNAPYFFKEAENARKHLVHRTNREFIFFAGGKEEGEKVTRKAEAKKEIREIINQAKDICYVCDPYFNVNDLIEYIFYVKNSGVTIRILNCKGPKYVNKKKAALILDAINEYNSKPFQKIECRMLLGSKKSLLHDRFLISDTNVWFLGSSFSEFGDRATCMAKVPDSSNIQILKEVDKWFFNKTGTFTQSIEDYINGTIDEENISN